MTGQNISTAVMQRRHPAPDSLDYFPTPPFATRALIEVLRDLGEPVGALTAWEPACGELHMVRPLREIFANVRASDVHCYCDGHELIDFPLLGAGEPPVDWVVTNPPFALAEEFIATALNVAKRGVAMLARISFLESDGRVAGLFARTPPARVAVFGERVVMLKGRLIRRGSIDPFAEEPGRRASSATSYCWLIWTRCAASGAWERDTRLRWIPPSMERLERAGDYPDYDVAVAIAPAPLFEGEAG